MPLKIFSFLPSQTEPSIRRLSITPLSPLLRSHLLRYFWDQCSIRAQLLLVVALMNVIARLIGGTVAILRVRAQTGIEMAALLAAAQ